MLKKIDIEDLFQLYFEKRHECSGHELDISDIDYEAFAKSLEQLFYDTSISLNQHCFVCKKKVGYKHLVKSCWLCEQCFIKDLEERSK